MISASEIELPKILYLFGAGATHAEILNSLKIENNSNKIDKYGLLINHISERVLSRIKRNVKLSKSIKNLLPEEKKGNIELLISLIESNRLPHFENISSKLKSYVEHDINKIIDYASKKSEFDLYQSLLEFHKHNTNKEDLIGLITLNYESLLDYAYETHYEKPSFIEYGLTSSTSDKPPLLKLHGSFSWNNILINNDIHSIQILPLGTQKNYLDLPYTFIWGKSLELLTQCDILRVVGCSLDLSDWGLIDLLFKAHVRRKKPLKIEIIDYEDVGQRIKSKLGFFSGLEPPKSIENGIIANYPIDNPDNGINVFKIWIMEKAKKAQINNTNYISKLSVI